MTTTIITSIINFLSEHAFAWGKRLLYLALLLSLWTLFVDPYIYNIRLVMMWILNMTFFKVLSEQSISFILYIFVLGASLKILLWFFSHPNKEPHEIGHASGFSSRKV